MMMAKYSRILLWLSLGAVLACSLPKKLTSLPNQLTLKKDSIYAYTFVFSAYNNWAKDTKVSIEDTTMVLLLDSKI